MVMVIKANSDWLIQENKNLIAIVYSEIEIKSFFLIAKDTISNK